MILRVSSEAVADCGGRFEALLLEVNERLATDAKYECLGPGCGSTELARNYNRWFGQTLLACYDFDLADELGRELRWLAGMMARRGFDLTFLARMLEAWSVAFVSQSPWPLALVLVGPLDELRRNLGVVLESAQAVPEPTAEVAAFVRLLLARERRAAAEAALGRKTPVIRTADAGASGSPARRASLGGGAGERGRRACGDRYMPLRAVSAFRQR